MTRRLRFIGLLTRRIKIHSVVYPEAKGSLGVQVVLKLGSDTCFIDRKVGSVLEEVRLQTMVASRYIGRAFFPPLRSS